jgi:hypothetical protein
VGLTEEGKAVDISGNENAGRVVDNEHRAGILVLDTRGFYTRAGLYVLTLRVAKEWGGDMLPESIVAPPIRLRLTDDGVLQPETPGPTGAKNP